ncbi:hypothetical protein CWE13_08225 [Aliidiomarina shirensis]|uniref:RNA polymerase subunit sigma-70 n=1 Tax=Aliidiomarina shirensis TaxID=1048642 RepID=A0A432WSS5_9GAMM|nr:RNA polymerase sigma factor [Aliidiomarina shirensis]RUO36823.1 hypothetical protein CWE13_08225 [Aliidiomarina shirensis]
MHTLNNPYLQWYSGGLALARNLLGCPDTAQDVLQTAITKTLSNKRMPDDQAAQRVWFFKVVRNGCFDYLRQQQKFDSSAVPEEVLGAAEVIDEVEASERQRWVRAALLTLTVEQREIIVLRDVNDLSYAEIAQVLQMNSGTVMSRLHRSRMALRAALQDLKAENGGVYE